MAAPYWLFVESMNAEVGPIAPEFGSVEAAALVAAARSDNIRAVSGASDFVSRWRLRPVVGLLDETEAAAWEALASINAFATF
jgi:hypothetical protein